MLTHDKMCKWWTVEGLPGAGKAEFAVKFAEATGVKNFGTGHLTRTEEMIKVSHKELKENQKRKKKQDEEDDEPEDDDKRLTGEQISRMEERELNLMKQLKIDNAKKSKLPDAKFCICQRVAKSVSYFDLCYFQFRSIKIPKTS